MNDWGLQEFEVNLSNIEHKFEVNVGTTKVVNTSGEP
jgi:hypothetical protein